LKKRPPAKQFSRAKRATLLQKAICNRYSYSVVYSVSSAGGRTLFVKICVLVTILSKCFMILAISAGLS